MDAILEEIKDRLKSYFPEGKTLYVTPCAIPDGPRDPVPEGFVFDGASGVPNLLLEASARHDWHYATGCVPKWKADLIYGWELTKHHFYIRGPLRAIGLSPFGWWSWIRHRNDLNPSKIERRILPTGIGTNYDYNVLTWKLDDLKLKEIV